MDLSAGRRLASPWGVVAGWLPRGGGLGEAAWLARHHGICVLLWVHVAALPPLGMVRGQGLLHSLAEAGIIGSFAVGAQVTRFGIAVRSGLATLGLLTSSAVIVHVFDGLIEMHFHFFVMVAVAALYQAWQPFLLALTFVVLHHSLTGTFAPHEVYNHSAAVDDPWLWGLVHGGFVLAESVACLVYWRASEETLSRERDARLEAQNAHRALADAQELAGVGSWTWDISSGEVAWSEQLYVLAGVDRQTFAPSIESFLALVHPEDRDRVGHLIQTAYRDGSDLDYECRLARPDGSVRIIHALGESVWEDDGTLTQMRGTCHDVTERKRLQEEITHLAFHDPLTGLPNRRLFLERLERALAHHRRGHNCAIMFIDLDNFKAINDSYGHTAGDAVLQEVARRLQDAVRSTDTVARFGGDEFALLCEGTEAGDASETAERIRLALDPPCAIEGTSVAVRASVGIAVADAETSADALLREADAGMYAVKTLGTRRHPFVASRRARGTAPGDSSDPGSVRDPG